MASAVFQPPSARVDQPLAPHTSLKVGGPADLFVKVADVEQALSIYQWSAERQLPCRWIGGGSNLLVADSGLAGVAARLTDDRIELPSESRGQVISGAGRSFPNLGRALARAGWSGLEWSANVPGTVGGAIVNNAGAFGSCVADCLAWAEVLGPEGNLQRFVPERLEYAYRTSRLKRGELGPVVVVRAAFLIRRAPATETMARVRQFQERRTATQPRELSAGSIFANPPGDYAGRLIEACDLKGRRVGGAQISDQHANFIVNRGGAKAMDVYHLARLVQDEVWRRHNCWLMPEIELIGRWSERERSAMVRPGPA